MFELRRLILASVLLIFGQSLLPGGDSKDKKAPGLPETVSYYKDVRPIFQQHCQGCHQPAVAKGGFVMTGYAELFKKSDHDLAGIVAGQPAKSEIVNQITSQKGKPAAMPREKEPLTQREVALIVKWITQGAKDDTPA